MIAFLEGTVAGKTLASAYINVAGVGGVGFEVGMSSSSLSKLPDTGEAVLVFTYLQVRDDGMALFGFLSLEEKALFEKLIAVSGVGPKVALAALSSYAPAQLADLIAAQDVAAVTNVVGNIFDGMLASPAQMLGYMAVTVLIRKENRLCLLNNTERKEK